MVDLTLLPGSLDLYELLVNYVAGGIFLSLILWGLILLITGIIGRMSMSSILVILITYFSVILIGYVGALAGVPLFLFALYYMIVGILNWVNQLR